jgi:hypothetical protein
MWRYGVGLFAVLCALSLPANGRAQVLPFIDAISGFSLGTVEIQPSVKVGYQDMAVNINLPSFTGLEGNSLFAPSSLDFSLKDAGVWIGSVRVDLRRGAYSLFLSAEGNAGKAAHVFTPSEPYWAGFSQVEWRGSQLEWWSIGEGASVDIGMNAAAVGGFKAEHLSVRLEGPVDPTMAIQYEATLGDLYTGDLRTKLWVPYVGLRVDGLDSRATLIFSPYAWADVTIPFRYFFYGPPFYPWFAFEDARYTFNPGGIFLEGNFDYLVRASESVSCTLWFKGSWCQIRGRGAEDYRLDVIDPAGFPLFSGGILQSLDGSFASYVLAGGLSFLYTF